ncbi:hypothetical protein GBA52_026338 [Prunus armeniaca]|nr:hypothetical protein GBA52_026338 [Prunus armeniaca]
MGSLSSRKVCSEPSSNSYSYAPNGAASYGFGANSYDTSTSKDDPSTSASKDNPSTFASTSNDKALALASASKDPSAFTSKKAEKECFLKNLFKKEVNPDPELKPEYQGVHPEP